VEATCAFLSMGACNPIDDSIVLQKWSAREMGQSRCQGPGVWYQVPESRVGPLPYITPEA
jgi:hypothetical protein